MIQRVKNWSASVLNREIGLKISLQTTKIQFTHSHTINTVKMSSIIKVFFGLQAFLIFNRRQMHKCEQKILCL